MTASPLKTIFIDRNSGGRISRDLIVKTGIPVRIHDEEFKDTRTQDHVWLKAIGERGWIMVTGDKATLKDYLFLFTLRRTKAHVFIMDSMNGTTKEEKADCVINNYKQMIALCEAKSGPRMWRERGGKISEINFRKIYSRMRRLMGC